MNQFYFDVLINQRDKAMCGEFIVPFKEKVGLQPLTSQVFGVGEEVREWREEV